MLSFSGMIFASFFLVAGMHFSFLYCSVGVESLFILYVIILNMYVQAGYLLFWYHMTYRYDFRLNSIALLRVQSTLFLFP
jgi:hypothetical protein